MSLMVISCEIEEITEDIADSGLVHKRFTAVIEGGEVTKTLLDENVEDGVRNLLWDPGDVIGIGIQGKEFCKFTNVRTDAAADGFFEGSISEVSNYFAIYPWKENLTMTTELTLEIPSRQTYRENSFDIDVAPMVGRGNNGESIYFQNLCGVLAIPMTGSDMISWIILTAKDSKGDPAFISGDFSVDMGYEDFPYPMPVESSQTKIILDCGSGVQLDSEAETYFHIVLPPGKYYGFDLRIITADGKLMRKSTDNTLTLRRSMITKTAVFEYQENVGAEVFTDLSLRGNANCYIVPSEGFYSFDASTIGNGTFGLVKGAGFHTDDVKISPVSAEILWSVPDNVIEVLSFDKSANEVRFTASGVEGNALVAVKDADGTILWSWHIWMTDRPADQNYENDVLGSFVMLDRNIGAIRADRGTGDEWKESIGLYYQWGRKDPFTQDKFTVNSSAMSAGEALKYPATLIYYWALESTVVYWNPEKKTVYDPCPVGYRVPAEDVWYGFTDNGDSQYDINENHVSSTTWDYGWSFYINSASETAWYPATGCFFRSTGKVNTDYGYLWSANKSGNSGYYMYFVVYGSIYQNEITKCVYGFPVRCMKDDGHVDIALPFVEIQGARDVTTESVLVELGIECNAADVTEFGIIYGTSPGVSTENGTKILGTDGENCIEISGLTEGTKYYIVAYATNSYGTTFSKEKSFYTKYENSINLSESGTSNCYIVSGVGPYTFDASVKGNSNESVGVPVSASVVWETKNTDQAVSVGDIVRNVTYADGRVSFETTGVDGNALIAVKDVSDVILWSWHIWVTDYDPETDFDVYASGAKMMDRNLGALNTEHGDVLSFGLFYQQGRKDPFVGCANVSNRTFAATAPAGIIKYVSSGSADLSIKNPHILYGSATTKWTVDKGIYDPCPVGWKVPSESAWSGFMSSNKATFTYGVSYTSPSSTPDAYFPLTGDTQYGEQTLRNPGSTGYLWITTSYYAYNFTNQTKTSRSAQDENPVRCMKE